MDGFSIKYNWKIFEKMGDIFTISIPLDEKSIHIFQIYDGKKYRVIPDIPTIKYKGEEWNVIVVGYDYSIELIQQLYKILEKESKITLGDMEDFFLKFKNFEINSKITIYDYHIGTLLHFSSIFQLNSKIILLLLNKGIDENITLSSTNTLNFDNKTALEIASDRKNEKFIHAYDEFKAEVLKAISTWHYPSSSILLEKLCSTSTLFEGLDSFKIPKDLIHHVIRRVLEVILLSKYIRHSVSENSGSFLGKWGKGK